jgi:pimeloyl-ACP methyl ester carboxylesterase
MPGNDLKDRYVKVGSINTRYWAEGDKGPSMVLIHGLGGSIENWVSNIGALAENHHVYALDLVGFGRSDKPEVPYSVSYLKQFVIDFLALQGVEKATIVGNSMGGAVALHLAFSRPDMVDNIVLVDSGGFGTQVHINFRLVTLPLIGERLIHPSRKGTIAVLNTIFFDPSVITEEMIDVGQEIATLPGCGQAFLTTARSFLSFWGQKRDFVRSITDNVHRLRCPTLIIWGKQDKVLPIEHAHVAASVVPNATLQVFDSCGHAPQAERPVDFNATVLQFLAG